jgi:hypothetical protein
MSAFFAETLCLMVQGLNHKKKQPMEFDFKDGEAIIKRGRKIIAKVFDRYEYYKKHNMAITFSNKYPYSLEIPNIGMVECENLTEVERLLSKYCPDPKSMMYTLS